MLWERAVSIEKDKVACAASVPDIEFVKKKFSRMISERRKSLAVDRTAVAEQGDTFLVCMFKSVEGKKDETLDWVDQLVLSIRKAGGKIHVHCHTPKDWEIFEGKDNFVPPNHLNPAVFDFDCFLLVAFDPVAEDQAERKPSEHMEAPAHTWWKSDEVFELLKRRQNVEKIGIYGVEGMQKGVDVGANAAFNFGEKLMLFEFMIMHSFPPIQRYIDGYKRSSACKDAGVDVRMILADGVYNTYMKEIQLDAVCASSWRMKSDVTFFYESEKYQKQLMPLRGDYSRSLVILLPIKDAHLRKKKLAPLSSLGA